MATPAVPETRAPADRRGCGRRLAGLEANVDGCREPGADAVFDAETGAAEPGGGRADPPERRCDEHACTRRRGRRSGRGDHNGRRGLGQWRRLRDDVFARVDPAGSRELRDRQRQQARAGWPGCATEVDIGARRGASDKIDPHARTVAGQACSRRPGLATGADGGDLDGDQLPQAVSVDVGTTLQCQVDEFWFASSGLWTRQRTRVRVERGCRGKRQQQTGPPQRGRVHSMPPWRLTASTWGPAG